MLAEKPVDTPSGVQSKYDLIPFQILENKLREKFKDVDCESIINLIVISSKNGYISLFDVFFVFQNFFKNKDTLNYVIEKFLLPFFVLEPEMSRISYKNYLNFNLKLIIMKEFNVFSFRDFYDESKDNQLSVNPIYNIDYFQSISKIETISVILMLLFFSSIPNERKSSILFNLLDTEQKGVLKTGKKNFYLIFRKMILISLFLPDIMTNQEIATVTKQFREDIDKILGRGTPTYDTDTGTGTPSSINDNSIIFYQGYTSLIFEYKKILFFIKHTKSIMKNLVTFISHSFVFFESTTDPKVTKEEFLLNCKRKNYLLFSQAVYRSYLVQYLFHCSKQMKAFFAAFPKVIHQIETSVLESKTNTIFSSELSIKEICSQNDFREYSEVLSSTLPICQSLISSDDYRVVNGKNEFKKATLKRIKWSTQKELDQDISDSGKKKSVKVERQVEMRPSSLSIGRTSGFGASLDYYAMMERKTLESQKRIKKVPPKEKKINQQEKHQEEDKDNINNSEKVSDNENIDKQEEEQNPEEKEEDEKEDKSKDEKENQNEDEKEYEKEDKKEDEKEYEKEHKKEDENKSEYEDENEKERVKSEEEEKDKDKEEREEEGEIRNENQDNNDNPMLTIQNLNQANEEMNKMPLNQKEIQLHLKTSSCDDYEESPKKSRDLSPIDRSKDKSSYDLNEQPRSSNFEGKSQKNQSKNKLSSLRGQVSPLIENDKSIDLSKFRGSNPSKKEEDIFKLQLPEIGNIAKKDEEADINSEDDNLKDVANEIKIKQIQGTTPNDRYTINLDEGKPFTMRQTYPSNTLNFSSEVRTGRNFLSKGSMRSNSGTINTNEIDITNFFVEYFNDFSGYSNVPIDRIQDELENLPPSLIRKLIINKFTPYLASYDPLVVYNILIEDISEGMMNLYFILINYYNIFLRNSLMSDIKVSCFDINFFNMMQGCCGNSSYDQMIELYKDDLYQESRIIFDDGYLIVIPIILSHDSSARGKRQKLFLSLFDTQTKKVRFLDSDDTLSEMSKVVENYKAIFNDFLQYLTDKNISKNATGWEYDIDSIESICYTEDVQNHLMVWYSKMICETGEIETIEENKYTKIKENIFKQVAMFFISLGKFVKKYSN